MRSKEKVLENCRWPEVMEMEEKLVVVLKHRLKESRWCYVEADACY